MDNEKKLSDAQRKALAQLVERKYERLITEAKDREGKLVDEITEKVKVELGVDTLDNQIETMERQIKVLEDKKEKLGFNSYGLDGGSKAKLLVDGRVKKESTEIVKLETTLTKKLASIWVAPTLEEAKHLIDAV